MRSLVLLARRIQLSLALLALLISYSAFSESKVDLDPTFADGGVAKIVFGSGKSWASTGLTQPDGKIIVVGSIEYKGHIGAIALTRTDPNGKPDHRFGNKGVVITKVGVNSRSTAVGLMPDGRLVVAGWAYVEKGKEGITLAMYNVDGTLDSRFGDRGLLIFPMEYSTAYVYTLAVQSDGKIVIGGKITIQKEYRDSAGLFIRSVPDDYVFLARLNGNGSFDASFGTNRVVVTDVGGGSIKITGLALQLDGKLIATGTRYKKPNSTIVLARYNANGSLDKSFGVEGQANRTMEKGWYGSPTISTLPDGRILLICGYSLEGESWLSLTQLHVDGSPDLAFGENGTITKKTKFRSYIDFIPVKQPDGKILISGMSLRPPMPGKSQPPFYYSFGIARFLPTGDADNSFGQAGMHVVSIGDITDSPAYMTAQDNGRIIIAGHSDNEVTQHVVIVGLLP